MGTSSLSRQYLSITYLGFDTTQVTGARKRPTKGSNGPCLTPLLGVHQMRSKWRTVSAEPGVRQVSIYRPRWRHTTLDAGNPSDEGCGPSTVLRVLPDVACRAESMSAMSCQITANFA